MNPSWSMPVSATRGWPPRGRCARGRRSWGARSAGRCADRSGPARCGRRPVRGVRPAQHLRVLGRDMRPAMPGKRVLVRDHRPAVLDRQLVLPGRHEGASRAERLDESPLADSPEPVVARHLPDHRWIAQIRGPDGQRCDGRSVAPTFVAVAHGTPGHVDLSPARDHARISPRGGRNVRAAVLGRYGGVDMPGATGFYLVIMILVVVVLRAVTAGHPPSGPDREKEQGHHHGVHRPLAAQC